MPQGLILIALQSAGSTGEPDRLFDMLRLSWLLLGLTGLGILGVIMLAVLRRMYIRRTRASRSPRAPADAAHADPWSESAKRLRMEPPAAGGKEEA